MLSVVGRIFNERVSSKPGCHSFLKLRRESKEVSQLRDEVKESALKRGWRYTEKEEEVQGC